MADENRNGRPTWTQAIIVAFLVGMLTDCVMDQFKASNSSPDTPKTRVTEPCRPGTTLHVPKEGKYKDFLICLPDFANP